MEQENNENVLTNEKTIKENNGGNKKKTNIIMIVVALIIIALTIGCIAIVYSIKNKASVATFEGGELTSDEFMLYYKMYGTYMSYYGYELPDIINEAASQKVYYTIASQNGATVSDEDKEYVNSICDDEEYLAQLESQGINAEDMRKYGMQVYTTNAYVEKLAEELSDEDYKAYLTSTYGEDVDMHEYVTRYILFKTINDDGEALSDEEIAEKEAKANAALARANNGENFASLAEELSEDSSTASNGGLYKVYIDEKTDEDYKNAAISLEVGKYTLIKNQYGYNVILLESVNENGRMNSSYDRNYAASAKFQEDCKSITINMNAQYAQSLIDAYNAEVEAKNTSTTSSQDTTTTSDAVSSEVEGC